MIPTSFSAARSSQDSGRWYTLIIRGLFSSLAFVIPLVVFPWTVDRLEINKQAVLLVIGSLILLAALGRALARKSVTFRVHPSLIFLGVFLFLALISSVLSSSPYASWTGGSGQEYLSFLTLGMAGLLAVLAGSLDDEPLVLVRWTVVASLCGSAIVGTVVALGTLGFPIVTSGFVGTPNAIGVYLVALSVLGCASVLFAPAPPAHRTTRESKPDVVQGVIWLTTLVTSICAIIVLLGVDYWLLWMLLLLGTILLFVRIFSQSHQIPRVPSLIAPMILSVCSVLFLILPSPLSGAFPVEVSPSYSASWDLVTSSLGEHSWFFGAGPGTFVEAYTKFGSSELNSTNFWDVRFDRPPSQALTMFQAFGLLGCLFFFLWVAWTFFSGWATREEENEEVRAWRRILWSGWTVLGIAALFYSSNMVLTVFFFLLSGLILGLAVPQEKTIAFSQSPRAALASLFTSVFCAIAVLTLLFVTCSRYAAQVVFANAVSADESGVVIDDVLSGLGTAAKLDRWNDEYYRNLAHALFMKVSDIAKDPNAKPDDIRSLVGSTINAARRATTLAPEQVVNWALLGDVYREIAPIAGGADGFAITSYQKAIELAPNNPKYYVSLGRAYLVTAESQGSLLKSEDKEAAAKAKAVWDEALVNAVTNLLKAAELKSDYAPAQYYLAAAYERQGNLSDAISRMEEVKKTAPNDVGVALQLGLFYLRQGKIDAGQTELERAVSIAPNFSNARWFLSAVYEQKGEFDKAIEQLNEIAKFNSENDLVTQRLARLQEEKTAAEAPPAAVDTTPLEEGTGGVTLP